MTNLILIGLITFLLVTTGFNIWLAGLLILSLMVFFWDFFPIMFALLVALFSQEVQMQQPKTKKKSDTPLVDTLLSGLIDKK